MKGMRKCIIISIFMCLCSAAPVEIQEDTIVHPKVGSWVLSSLFPTCSSQDRLTNHVVFDTFSTATVFSIRSHFNHG